MITNTGKDIIAKYLLGQAPAFASHIAIGSGKKPLQSTDSLAPYQSEFAYKENLNFEMFRVPIVSRGYVSDADPNIVTITGVSGNGTLVTYTAENTYAPGDIVDISGTNISAYNMTNAIVYSSNDTQFTVKSSATGAYTSGGIAIGRISKIVLTAELPTEQRYEITEIGIYSARSNPSATNKDSRMLYAFAETENWEYHGTSSAIGIGTTISTPLYAGAANTGTINPNLGPAPAFRATSDNAVFDSDARLSKYERCRFLNTAIYVPGDMSRLFLDGQELSYTDSVTPAFDKKTHIHLAGTTLDLSQNSPEDEIRLAFSIIHKDESFDIPPTKAYILIEFAPEESTVVDPENFAKFQVNLTSSTPGFSGFDDSRYHVVSNKLGDLVKGTSFTWGSVKLLKVYASITSTLTVTNKALTDNVATLTTEKAHGFAVGSVVTVTGVDNVFNGTYQITAIPDPNTVGGAKQFSYAKVETNVTSTSSTGTAEAPSSNYLVGLDALRLENVSTLNPLYGLTGYSVIRTADARPIVKDANSSNLVEFRFGLDVL